MTEKETWHYGVVAEWWSEFNVTGPEISYFERLIARYGEPALDVACGTGRLLLPFLRNGLDVDGCDISADMIALCRDTAARAGLAPRLYVQATHELALPRSYQTAVMCGAIGLGGERARDLEALRRLHTQLEPGGTLILDNHVPYLSAEQWSYWTDEKRGSLPEPWSTPSEPRITSSGTGLVLNARLLDLDPLEQVASFEMCAQRWRGEALLREERYTLRYLLYFKNELLMMLHEAGFVHVRLEADYSDATPTRDSKVLVFIARKAGDAVDAGENSSASSASFNNPSLFMPD